MRELQPLKNKIAIVLAGQLDVDLSCYLSPEYYLIAVDGGLDHIIASGHRADILIGDLDSVTAIDHEGPRLVFDSVKDDTDFVCAINHALDYNADAQIFVFGFGSIDRIDHVLANLSVIRSNMQFISNNQHITLLTADTVVESDDYQYYSFFSLDLVSRFSLSGFKYPLTDYCLKPYDPLCVSNELMSDSGKIEISNGRVILIKSKIN